MKQLMANLLPFSILLCLATVGFTGEPASAERDPERGPDGQRVRQYTKRWTDDYYNDHHVVYSAYDRTIKDSTGAEFTVETWHGRATGYHKNGQKAWEAVYRDGKREGRFTSWAANGTRTILSQVEAGELNGSYMQWAPDGRKVREETYRRGKRHGEARWWAPDGRPAAAGTFRDGLPWDGTFVELDPLPRSRSVVRRYERGQRVSEEDVPGGSSNWW